MSSFWTENGGSYSLLVNKMPSRARIQRVIGTEGARRFRELFDTLIGANTGGTALATYRRIAGETSAQIGGGVRTIDTVTVINRASTAADVTALKEFTVNVARRPTTYPRDLSGNGGGTF